MGFFRAWLRSAPSLALPTSVGAPPAESKDTSLEEDLEGWIRRYELFTETEKIEKVVEAASVFGTECAPSNSRYDEILRASKFTAIFFYLDDRPSDETDEDWKGFHEALMRLFKSDEAKTELVNGAVKEWLEEIGVHGKGTKALDDLHESFEDYCKSLDDERKSRHRFHEMSLEEFMELRRQTIFVGPFIDYWRVLMEKKTGGENLPPDYREGFLKPAMDLVIYVNDLGSLDRDLAENSPEMNCVINFMRNHNITDVHVGVRWAQDSYRELAEELANVLVAAAKEFESTVDLLECVVDGNLEATLKLTERYPGTRERLEPLPRLKAMSDKDPHVNHAPSTERRS